MDAGFGDVLQELFIKVVMPIVGTAISIYLPLILHKVLKRYHLGILDFMADRLTKDVNVWVLAEENIAAERIKTGGDKIPGCTKFTNVLSQAIAKYPAISEDQIKKVINATVLSIPGIGPVDLLTKESPNGRDSRPDGGAQGRPIPTDIDSGKSGTLVTGSAESNSAGQSGYRPGGGTAGEAFSNPVNWK